MRIASSRAAWRAASRLSSRSLARPATLTPRYVGIARTSAIRSQQTRCLATTRTRWGNSDKNPNKEDDEDTGTYSEADHEHAVISTFDLFSIGIGPSSSHTVGPMRAGNIFVTDLVDVDLLQKVDRIHIAIYGSLALTGEGHMTPSALLLGLEGENVETVDTDYVPKRFEEIKETKKLFLGNGLGEGKGKEVDFDYEKSFKWQWSKKLPLHSNGMRLSVFDKDGEMLATNDLFSVGGGFVVNGALSITTGSETELVSYGTPPDAEVGESSDAQSDGKHPVDLAENMFYKGIRRQDVAGDRRTGSEVKPLDEAQEVGGESLALAQNEDSGSVPQVYDATPPPEGIEFTETATDPSSPRYPFRDATSLLALCNNHNLTIAQLVYENEKSHGYTDDEIRDKLLRIWEVMDNCILEGVTASPDSPLPGSLKTSRRAPALYRRLTRGIYSSHSSTEPTSGQIASGKKGSDSKAVAGTQQNQRSGPPRIHGSLYHPIVPSPLRRTKFPESTYLRPRSVPSVSC